MSLYLGCPKKIHDFIRKGYIDLVCLGVKLIVCQSFWDHETNMIGGNGSNIWQCE